MDPTFLTPPDQSQGVPLPTPNFGALFEIAPVAQLLVLPDDPVFTMVAANEALLRLVKLRREDLLGRGVFVVFPGNPDDPNAPGVHELRASLRRVIATRAPDEAPARRYDLERPAAEGGGFEERYWRVLSTPVLGPDAHLEYILQSTSDVTAEVLATRELRASEARAIGILESITDGFAALDSQWRFIYCNPEAERILGFTRDQLVGQDHWQMFPGTPGTIVEVEYRRAVRDRVAVEFEIFYQPWQRWLAVRAYPTNEGGLSIYFRDFTEQKLANTTLRESEQRYRFLAESIPQMVWTATPDGALDYVNGQGEAYFQTKAALLCGAGWLDWVHPHDRKTTIAQWQASLSNGQPYDTAFRLLRSRDQSWRWHLVRALPFAGPDGSVIKWFGICTDIHDQRVTEEELRRVNHELEEFAYVASHDLQEPLRMVNIYSQLIVRNLGNENARLKEYERFVRQGVERMDALIQDLLTFSHTVQRDEQPPGVADLSASLSEALSVLKDRIEESGAEIRLDSLPVVPGDTNQFSHVFQNLLSNSLKYCRPGLNPKIAISADREDGHWIVALRDNGIGFEQQHAKRIFGLFKRLHKDEYPGTGLGLAICERIVNRYGGRIWAQSNPGEGATFFLSLPVVE